MKTHYNIPTEFIESLEWISVNDVFNTEDWNKLPKFLHEYNSIYYVRNQVNGKGYVGKTSQRILDRWASNAGSSHKTSYIDQDQRPLYLAMYKYGLDNLQITLLQTVDNSSMSLTELESYWINELHTCVKDPIGWGYNLTYGGEDCTHLHTQEVNERRIRTILDRYNGNYPFTLPEVRERILRTNLRNGNGDCMYMCHTPESYSRMVSTQKNMYGGHLACNQPEIVMNRLHTQRINNGGTLPMNSESAIHNQRISRIFYYINRNINRIKDDGLVVTPKIYFDSVSYNHLHTVLNAIECLTKDNRWTDEMKSIFDHIKYNSSGVPELI